jgi:S1-C subfamily serine protease
MAARDMDDLTIYLAGTSVGQTITLEIIRGEERQRVDITLEERPAH